MTDTSTAACSADPRACVTNTYLYRPRIVAIRAQVIQREIKVMSQIENPDIVQYFASFMEGSILWIVMEYLAGGSLKDLIDIAGPLPEDAIAAIMRSLLRALDYLHKGRKLHRDIKAANILLSGNGDVKLADFGVAGQMTQTLRQRNTFVGSPFWMAPEVIRESAYDEKADIWSVGITAIELATGLPPYADVHYMRAILLIPQSDPPTLDGPDYSKLIKSFIADCLQKNPTERASAEQLLSHPFLKKARSGAIRDAMKRKRSLDQSSAPGMSGTSTPSLHSSLNSSLAGSIRDLDGTDGTRPVGGAPGSAPGMWEFDSVDGLGVPSAADTPAASDDSMSRKSSTASTASGVPKDEKAKSRDISAYPMSASPASTPSPGSSSTLDMSSMSVSIDSRDAAKATSSPPMERGLTARAQPEKANSTVLSDLVLPVISQMRADIAAQETSYEDLMDSLGALEVAFNDAESSRSGVAATFVRALFMEALVSKSAEVRSILVQALDHHNAEPATRERDRRRNPRAPGGPRAA